MRTVKLVAVLGACACLAPGRSALAQEARPPEVVPPGEVEVTPPSEVPVHDDAFARPPPGSAADQALWKAGRQVDNAIPMARGESAKLQWRVKQGQFNERLARLEQEGPPEKARKARQAGEKVIAARDRNYEILSRRWPVDPTRVCSYPLLDFSSALTSGTRPADRALQDETRKRLQDCVDKARLILKSVDGSNKELAAALAALEAELPPLVPATGPAGSVPTGGPGAKPALSPEGK
ncbi:MAG: hypothetical protein WB493_10695 [Anaeromyxobacteraceae bacterium]